MLKRYVINLIILLSASAVMYGSEDNQQQSAVMAEIDEVGQLYDWFKNVQHTKESCRPGGDINVQGKKYKVDKVIEKSRDQHAECLKAKSSCEHRFVQVIVHEKDQSPLKTAYWTLQGNSGSSSSVYKPCVSSFSLHSSNFPLARWTRAESNPYWNLMFKKPTNNDQIQSNDVPPKEYRCTDSELPKKLIGDLCIIETRQRELLRDEDLGASIHQEKIIMQETTMSFGPAGFTTGNAPVKKNIV